MASTLQLAKVSAPWTDRVSVLVGHHTGYLVDMTKVVNNPCRQKLR